MQEITATEAKNNFGAFLNMAQHEPVRVMKNGRELAVLISEREYRDYAEHQKKKLFTLMDEMRLHAKKNGLTKKKLDAFLSELS